MGCFSVSAQQNRIVTQKGKTYYINKDGSKQKGWLELKGKKYYFDKKTGVQVKGWVKDSSGQAIRYFTRGAGYMVTGFITDSNGNTRHFDETTGLLTRGWLTDTDEYKYYFYSGSGRYRPKVGGEQKRTETLFQPGQWTYVYRLGEEQCRKLQIL